MSESVMNDLFGKFCHINTPWIAGKKTRYRIVASGMRSNTWCEVPVTGVPKPVRHNYFEEVCIVVLDTLVSEDSWLLRFALKDVEVLSRGDDLEEPEINPCRGCDDYDAHGGCKSHGGCGAERSEE